ncbi:MAG: hypothetical protein ACLTNE_07365 [Intestinimonas butyriciproducens]|uniref:hypothetical protein n=1 Tax=Intestinimonas butyriciproducens TaxID=1297617 RepID=UPI00399430F8|nr:hypothetical protein [Clostridiales bacterium]
MTLANSIQLYNLMKKSGKGEQEIAQQMYMIHKEIALKEFGLDIKTDGLLEEIAKAIGKGLAKGITIPLKHRKR